MKIMKKGKSLFQKRAPNRTEKHCSLILHVQKVTHAQKLFEKTKQAGLFGMALKLGK